MMMMMMMKMKKKTTKNTKHRCNASQDTHFTIIMKVEKLIESKLKTDKKNMINRPKNTDDNYPHNSVSLVEIILLL